MTPPNSEKGTFMRGNPTEPKVRNNKAKMIATIGRIIVSSRLRVPNSRLADPLHLVAA